MEFGDEGPGQKTMHSCKAQTTEHVQCIKQQSTPSNAKRTWLPSWLAGWLLFQMHTSHRTQNLLTRTAYLEAHQSWMISLHILTGKGSNHTAQLTGQPPLQPLLAPGSHWTFSIRRWTGCWTEYDIKHRPPKCFHSGSDPMVLMTVMVATWRHMAFLRLKDLVQKNSM